MDKYKLLTSKAFESKEKFQIRLNEKASEGYKAVNIAGTPGVYTVLMEKIH